MSDFLKIILQVSSFLLLQSILLRFLEGSTYEKYVRVISGFLLIMILVQGLLSLFGEQKWDLLSKIEYQMEYRMMSADVVEQTKNAEEKRRNEILTAYKERIFEKVENILSEERFFLIDGDVCFYEDGRIDRMELTASRTQKREKEWADDGAAGNRIEPIEKIRIGPVVDKKEEDKEKKETNGIEEELIRELAENFGILPEQIRLTMQE